MPNSLNFKRDHYCEKDQLGRDRYISILADMIQAEDFDTPFCIGIYGKWGSGKTSFMKQLEKELEGKLEANEKEPFPVTVWFNPWRYEKEEHLIVPFLKTIEHELTSKSESIKFHSIKTSLQTAAGKASKAARAFAYGAKLKFFGMADFSAKEMIAREGQLEDAEKEELTKLAESLPSIYYDITTHLEKTVSLKEFRLIVFIDDLDRCLPEKCVELLESIKLFLDLKGYLFVLGVDKDVVEQGIRHHYRFYNPENDENNKNGARIVSPDEYLDKMVQMPLELPPIEPSRKINFIKKLLGDSTFGAQASLIEAGLEGNPRTITRFVNYLAFLGRLAEALKKDVLLEPESPGRPENFRDLIEQYFTPPFYAKWAILVFSFPEEYREIKNTTQLIFDLQNSARGKNTAASEVENVGSTSEKPISAGLKKVLALGEPFPEESWLINKFIHLSASVGMALKEKSSGRETSSRDNLKTRADVIGDIGSMVTIRKGQFLYGEDKQTDSIDYDYEIDVYPVTNTQFTSFIKKAGYATKDFWSEKGWAWLQQEKVKEPQFFKDNKWNKPDQPIVGVSFFEAEAFAKWNGKRLPTEKEWERAARGDRGLEYPWGDEFDANVCNTKESSLGKTTVVNDYPQGMSPYGCMDMAGNIWDWTSSDYDKKFKELRGGSWLLNRSYARCASRLRFFPHSRDTAVGFRCARTVVK